MEETNMPGRAPGIKGIMREKYFAGVKAGPVSSRSRPSLAVHRALP